MGMIKHNMSPKIDDIIIINTPMLGVRKYYYIMK